ncbi:MAG TPA: dihydrolipoyl dehydrogenase [Phycisphaerae bacterium]|nr:dihydrolipoyl dehydrogenase [Phycisphaerae bacterium]
MVVGEFTQETDLLVIGGGPGGYTAAFRAAQRGIKTTIVEAGDALGGVCLHRGCIPSKTLLYVAELLNIPEHARDLGVEFAKPKIHLDGVNKWKGDVIAKLSKGLGGTAKRLKVDVVRGTAKFEDARHVTLSDSDVQRIRFKRCIVAAGSRPVELRGIQIDSPRVVNSTGALKLESIPKNALVVGGGYIGLELGTVLAALGSAVTVVEMLPALLAGCDPDLARPLIKRLEKQFAEIALETRVTGMKEKKGAVEVSFEGKNIPERKSFEQVLVAVGRRPNGDQLDVAKAGIELTDRGFIKVDDQLRTTNSRVYAIGDIIGDPMLAHKAMAEGKVVADILAGDQTVFEARCIPAVVFTDPEVAWVGLTEAEAKAKGIDVVVKKMQWAASGRATAIGRTDGLTKMICAADTQRVLGVGLTGPHVGEMIAEAALAIEMGAVATDISLTVHPHPTTSELLGEVADLISLPGSAPAH